MSLLLLFLLAVVLAYGIQVAVLWLGAPVLGERRPDLARTAVACLIVPWIGMGVSLLLALPIGCLTGPVGGYAPMAVSLAVTVAVHAMLYAVLLGLRPTRAAILAMVGMVGGWMTFGAVWFVNFGLGAPW